MYLYLIAPEGWVELDCSRREERTVRECNSSRESQSRCSSAPYVASRGVGVRGEGLADMPCLSTLRTLCEPVDLWG